MSLQPHADYPVPEETRRVARAAFPKGTLGLQLAELLGPMYHDAEFADLFSARGQPAAAPARLAVATVLQFAEGLSDRQAADAVRSRIDWKYALGLELTDAGFDHTVLSEFRARLVDHAAATRLLDTLLERLRERGLLKARGRQRTDSTHVLAAVRTMTRLERVGETLRAALNALAAAAPDWVRGVAPPEWYERYGHRVERYRLPKSEQARAEWAAVIAADGERLLAAVAAAPSDLAPVLALPAVELLRRVWDEQYTTGDGRLVWREQDERGGAAEMTQSPYDPEARHSAKGDTTWVGYKVHFTETCDPELPRVIVHTETTPATTPDDNMLDPVHEALAARDLLPTEHLVDRGYTDAEMLERTPRAYGVTVVGPVADDGSWQARTAGAYDQTCFQVDWECRVATCPAGKTSSTLRRRMHPLRGERWEARFSRRDCTPCPPRAQGEALLRARAAQTPEHFRTRSAARARVESTHAQAVRRCGLRRCRSRGLARTQLQHVLTATTINAVRVAAWFGGSTPAGTRYGAFAQLARAA